MKLVFETATFADAIGKASRVAPSKAGVAFDKAAGILLSSTKQTFPDGEEKYLIEVRATNLDIFYLEAVDYISVEGEGEWRLSSAILSGIMSKLPIGSGRNVTLEQNKNEVNLTSGKTRAKLRQLDASYFPTWDSFDPDLLDMVPDLGARIKQVDWAADKNGEPPMSGVHLDGQGIYATDRYRIATVPCEAEPIFKPVTVPAGIFDPLLKTMRDVAVGIDDNQFLLMPDPSTQIRAMIFAVPYPNIPKVVKRDQADHVKFKKADFLQMVDLAMVFGMKDRIPKMSLFLGSEEVAVMMADAEEGLLGDILSVPGYCDHKRITMYFTPKNLTDAVNASPSEEVTLYYNKEKPLTAVRIDGGSGYEAWVMPRRAESED